MLLNGILQHIDGGFVSVQTSYPGQVVRALISHQHGGHRLNTDLVGTRFRNPLRPPLSVLGDSQPKRALVTLQNRIGQGKVPLTLHGVRLKGVVRHKCRPLAFLRNIGLFNHLPVRHHDLSAGQYRVDVPVPVHQQHIRIRSHCQAALA